jgi:hypothetical protein
MKQPDSNPEPNPILPPHDPTRRYDQKEMVAGARALIDAALSETPEANVMLKRLEKQLFEPFNDDLRRVEILESEGRSTDEAWEELDRIKRQAGMNPR